MATLDELMELDREVEAAERRALTNLATHLREATREMPVQSRLALAFVRHADKFDLWATGSAPGLWGAHQLGSFADGEDD